MRPLGIVTFLFAAATSCLPLSLLAGNSTTLCVRGQGYCSSKPSIPNVADLYTVLNTGHLAPIPPPPYTGPIFSVTDWVTNKLDKAVQVLCPHAPHAPHAQHAPHAPHGQGLGNGRDLEPAPAGYMSKAKGLMSDWGKKIKERLIKWWESLKAVLKRFWRGREYDD